MDKEVRFGIFPPILSNASSGNHEMDMGEFIQIFGSVLADDVRHSIHRMRMISLRMRVGSSRSCLMSRV